jgi:uncharacterized damage-inducible protein DinB
MFSKNQFQTLFAYHWHTTQQLLDCAAKLDPAEYSAHPGYGRGSIHTLLFHVLRTDDSWRRGLESGEQQAPLPPEEFPDLAALQQGFAAEQAAWQRYLDGLSAEEIEGEIELTNYRGETDFVPFWRTLQHLILHGMQHHTEVAQLLTDKGQSPGDIDFIFYAG